MALKLACGIGYLSTTLTFLLQKLKYGRILEHRLCVESFEDIYQESSNDDLGLTFSFLICKVKIAFCAFIWEDFMNFVE